jgi:uncharacterized protein (DUF302 family)
MENPFSHFSWATTLFVGAPSFAYFWPRLGEENFFTLSSIEFIQLDALKSSLEKVELMSDSAIHGLITLASKYSVQETMTRLETLLREKGLSIFARIDHSGEAEKVGLKMHNTKLLIFGSPKAGTPLMQAAPTLAIDLPLKALIWEDGVGQVWLTYNDPAYLQQRHGFPTELLPNLAGAAGLLQKSVE